MVKLSKHFHECFRHSCSNERSQVKNRTEPWMSAEILDLMKNRDTFFIVLKLIFESYYQLRNNVNRDKHGRS